MAADYLIRPLTAADEPVLWDMLYQGLHSAPAENPPPPEIVRRPDLAQYVEAWGREGDRGFVAYDNDEPVGAVWFRPPGAGATPELAVAVSAAHRQRGLGAALLTRWVRANPEQSEISLRVGPTNPAIRLYERFGFSVAREDGQSVTMRRDLEHRQN